MIGEALKPETEPPLPKRFVAVARWVQVATVTWSIYIFGVIAGFGGLSRDWFYDKVIVSPLMNFSLAMGATILAMLIALVAHRSVHRWRPGSAFFSPLLVMIAMISAALVVVVGCALMVYLDWLLLRWLTEQGVTGWIWAVFAAVILGYIAAVIILELMALVAWAAVDCVQHWFGTADLHPMLPPLAMLLYAAIQTAIYIWKATHGEYAAANLTALVYVVTFGAPTCLALVALVQLHLLRKAGVKFSEAYNRRAT
ncbi:hypothetical protein ACFY03_22335 [Micromonospora chersina]|uniref:hypothetical protein n=1 Tax=Micromonospora chersina TaxID=47854 RepID=UPI00367710E2